MAVSLISLLSVSRSNRNKIIYENEGSVTEWTTTHRKEKRINSLDLALEEGYALILCLRADKLNDEFSLSSDGTVGFWKKPLKTSADDYSPSREKDTLID